MSPLSAVGPGDGMCGRTRAKCMDRLAWTVLIALAASRCTSTAPADPNGGPKRPRDHDFWATAREDYHRKQSFKTQRKSWDTDVPYAQGTLTYQGDSRPILEQDADDDSSDERRNGAPSPLNPLDRLAHKLGHRKEDEAASNAFSAQRFGPSMLLSGEAALINRPNPTPEEEDKLNSVQLVKAYGAQTLAPESYVHKIRQLREKFDGRDQRGVKKDVGLPESFDRFELFKAVLSAPASSGGPPHLPDRYGRARWLAEDKRQVAMSECVWKVPPPMPQAEPEVFDPLGAEAVGTPMLGIARASNIARPLASQVAHTLAPPLPPPDVQEAQQGSVEDGVMHIAHPPAMQPEQVHPEHTRGKRHHSKVAEANEAGSLSALRRAESQRAARAPATTHTKLAPARMNDVRPSTHWSTGGGDGNGLGGTTLDSLPLHSLCTSASLPLHSLCTTASLAVSTGSSVPTTQHGGRAEHIEDMVVARHMSFLCPVGRRLMKDPVMAADGHTYERGNIQEWIRRCQAGEGGGGTVVRSPITNQPLENCVLIANHCVRGAISEALDAAQVLHAANAPLVSPLPHTMDMACDELNSTTSRGSTACVTDSRQASLCVHAGAEEERTTERDRASGAGHDQITAAQAFALLRERKALARAQALPAEKLLPIRKQEQQESTVSSLNDTHVFHLSPTLRVETKDIHESKDDPEWSDRSSGNVDSAVQPEVHPHSESSDASDDNSEPSDPVNKQPFDGEAEALLSDATTRLANASAIHDQEDHLIDDLYGDAPTHRQRHHQPASVAVGRASTVNARCGATLEHKDITCHDKHKNTECAIQKGSQCWYSLGTNAAGVTEGKQVLVEVLSVDHSLQPPSYTILIENRTRETEAHRLKLFSNLTPLPALGMQPLRTNAEADSQGVADCAQGNGTSACAPPRAAKGKTALDQKQLEDEARLKEEELMRKKRVLHAALGRDSGDKRRKSLLDTRQHMGYAHILHGYPSKPHILSMKRCDLEALANKYPLILPPSHTSTHRVSSEALRSGALTHLEHRLQALLHVGRDKKAHHGDNKARCHPGASLDATACSQHTAGGGASNRRNGVSSVKSVEVDTGHMLTTAQGCMQDTWCNPRDDEAQVETALFDMAQTAAASSSVGKRARAALQSAWDLD